MSQLEILAKCWSCSVQPCSHTTNGTIHVNRYLLPEVGLDHTGVHADRRGGCAPEPVRETLRK